MRVTVDGGVEVLIPHWVRPHSHQVKQFIQEALEKLNPYIPQEKAKPLHSAAAVRRLVRTWAVRMGVQVGRIQMRNMQHKWGSCSGRGNLTLNTALYYVPLHLVEYVVVHELVHLQIFNHSPEFWVKLGEYLPDYQSREEELNRFRV